MYCFYDACNKEKFFSDTGDDCVVQRVKAMQLELEVILKHHLAMKAVTEKAFKDLKKYEKRNQNEKKLKETTKRKSPVSESSSAGLKKNRPTEFALQSFEKNHFDDDSSKSLDMFKPKFKKPSISVNGKENNESKSPSFSRFGSTFKGPARNSKPQRNLKQQKISFSKPKPQPEPEFPDSDATYCEEVERKKVEVSTKEPSLLKKSFTNVLSKKKTENPAKKSVTGLFNFKLPPEPQLQMLTQSEAVANSEPQSDWLHPLVVKEEPCSEIDIFASGDEYDSDVVCVEQGNSKLGPLTISDETEDFSLQKLESDFVKHTEYVDPSEAPEPTPVRKRGKVYGECPECREFYDNYAERYGPTQADEAFIRLCPTRCRGFQVRRKNAEPPPVLTHGPPPNDDNTPKGFWDIHTAKSPEASRIDDDDPDRTLDGL